MSSTNAIILSGLLFIVIPIALCMSYGLSRSQWGKRQENVVFTIGMLSYGIWWLVNFGMFSWLSEGGFTSSEIFLVMAPALALITGFVGVAAGRNGFKLRRSIR